MMNINPGTLTGKDLVKKFTSRSDCKELLHIFHNLSRFRVFFLNLVKLQDTNHEQSPTIDSEVLYFFIINESVDEMRKMELESQIIQRKKKYFQFENCIVDYDFLDIVDQLGKCIIKTLERKNPMYKKRKLLHLDLSRMKNLNFQGLSKTDVGAFYAILQTKVKLIKQTCNILKKFSKPLDLTKKKKSLTQVQGVSNYHPYGKLTSCGFLVNELLKEYEELVDKYKEEVERIDSVSGCKDCNLMRETNYIFVCNNVTYLV